LRRYFLATKLFNSGWPILSAGGAIFWCCANGTRKKRITPNSLLTRFYCCIIITTDMIKSQVSPTQTFGEFFRQKRIAAGFTLRNFCNRFGLDPAYISRIETDSFAPPRDKDKISALAQALGINEGSTDWVNFFDLAYISKGELPEDILENKKAHKILPLLFRTARGQRLSKKKLQELVDLINSS